MHRSLAHQSIFWDIAIVILLVIGCATVVGAYLWIALHPYSWLIVQAIIGVIATLAGIGVVLVIRGSFIEPQTITVNTKNVHIKGLPSINIAIVGDPHVGPYKGKMYLRRVVKKVNALKPDLIVLPGDFIYNHHASVSGLEPLKNLNATLGVFAVLGNHDTGHMLHRKKGTFIPYRTPDRTTDVVRALKKLHITVMRNQNRVFHIGKISFALAGSDHCWMDSCDLDQTFEGIPNNIPVVLLSHIPDAVLDKKSDRASLIISGHTHGGQVRLPFIGALYPIPDTLGKHFDQGLFKLKNGNILAITHGIGETMARARLFCPPEILLLKNRG